MLTLVLFTGNSWAKDIKTFSGKLSWRDGTPAANVQLRLYDGDPADGKSADDDLTTTEGKSNKSGAFTLKYDYEAYEDEGDFGVFGELFDDFNPYLICSYTVDGQKASRRIAFTDEIVLPNKFKRADLKLPELGNWAETTAKRVMTGFRPSQHGFKFRNSFPGYAVECDIRELEDFLQVDNRFGLCGGMSVLAKELCVAGKPVPADTTPPAKGSQLYTTLFQKQMDSLGDGFEVALKFLEWMHLDDGELGGTRALTTRQVEQAMKMLEQGQLPVLGLVLADWDNDKELWDNHQVLAYGYSESGPGTVDFNIYDPNHPESDELVIRCEFTVEGAVLQKTVLKSRNNGVHQDQAR